MADDPQSARAARAAARGSWPIRRFRLGEEPVDDLRATTTAAERLAMVEQLTLEAWKLAGKPLPTYARHETPIRVIRPPASRTGTDKDGAD